MDNFMDKLAQRFNAQEMIKANSQAEAQELNKVREQIKIYDECLQEMRKLNLKNLEAADQVRMLADQVNGLTGQAIVAIEERAKKENGQLGAALEELKTIMTAEQAEAAESRKRIEEQAAESRKLAEEQTAERLKELQGQIEENLKKLQNTNSQLEEFMHKESVKVYRNVQAVMLEELKGQTAELSEKIEQNKKSGKGFTALLAVTMILSLGNLAILIIQLLSQLGILAL